MALLREGGQTIFSEFLPGESHGQRSLVGYSPWGHRVRHDWQTLLLSRVPLFLSQFFIKFTGALYVFLEGQTMKGQTKDKRTKQWKCVCSPGDELGFFGFCYTIICCKIVMTALKTARLIPSILGKWKPLPSCQTFSKIVFS